MNVIELSKINKVREILLRDWDPFCVGDNPNLADEYDSFIPRIAQLLDSHVTDQDLNACLVNIERELSAPITDEQRKKTVIALQKIK